MKTTNIDGIEWPDVRNSKGEIIPGWFDFFNLYREMVERFDNAIFLEVGTWKGRSTVFMADTIKESGKDIQLYTVDIFGKFISQGIEEDTSDIYPIFMENITPYDDIVTCFKGDSGTLHNRFPDEYFDFIFIDGGHDYETISEDIKGWYPKLKKDGIFGGHDYDWPGVNKAIYEYFGDKVNIRGITWLINYK